MGNPLSKKTLLFLMCILYSLSVTSILAQTKTLEFSYDLLKINKLKGEDGIIYENITYEGLGKISESGYPSLPVKYLNILIPPNMDVEDISVNIKQKERIELINPVYPAQQPIPTSINFVKQEFKQPNKSIYSLEVYPKQAAEYIKDGYFDGTNHIVKVAVYPIIYYPANNYIELVKSINISLNYKASASKVEGPKYRTPEDQQVFDNALKSIIDNPEDISSYQIKPVQIATEEIAAKSLMSVPFFNYIIVTTSSLKDSFGRFIDWKKKKGINIGVVTIDDILANYITGDEISGINDAAGNLRKYFYDGWKDHGLMYVLLVGDYHSIPYRMGCGLKNTISREYYGPTDVYFSDLNGDWKVDNDNLYGESREDNVDIYPEIYVGRLLCLTPQEVSDWTDKLLEYEQNPFKGDFSKVTKSLWTSADQLQSEQQPQLVKASSVSYNFAEFTHKVMEETPNSIDPTGPTGTQVINALNEGYGFYNAYNHGANFVIRVATPGDPPQGSRYGVFGRGYYSSGIDEGTANLLTSLNGNCKSTIAYAVSCDVASFDQENLPATYPARRCIADDFTVLKNGGVAFLGNLRSGLIGYSYFLHEDFIKQLFNYNNYHLGQAEALSKAAATGGDDYHAICLTHTLFGDPEMPVWTATPSQFTNAQITESESSITINTGIKNCTITVCSIDNGNTYYLSKTISTASWTFNTTVRPLYVTITKQNYIPYTALTGGTLAANASISGNLKVLGSITVPSGKTLNISKGSIINFYNNSMLNVYGTLQVDGTPTDRIKLDFVEKQSGIKIFSSATGVRFTYADITNAKNPIYIENNTNNSYIRYCNISSSIYGIYFKSSDGEISNSAVHNISNYGGGAITAYGCSPLIKSNTITNNVGACYGIAVLNSATPYVYNNTISGNSSYGIYVAGSGPFIEGNTITSNGNVGIQISSYSTPLFGDTQSPYTGRNTITGHPYGIYVTNNSNANAGLSDGLASENMIYSNTAYNIYVCQSSTLYAQKNWWGQSSPATSKFYTESGSYFYYSPYLTSVPSWAAVPNIINTGASTITISANMKAGSVVMDEKSDLLYAAFNYKNNRQYNEAVKIYQKIIAESDSDGALAIAINELGDIYKKYSDPEIFNFLFNFTSTKYHNSNIYPLALEVLANIYKTRNEYDKTIELSDIIIEKYDSSNYVKNALLNKFYVYYDQQKYELARSVVISLQAEYSEDSDVFTASSLLKMIYDDLQVAIPKNMNANDIQSAQSDEEIPSTYGLSQNYPNPFNPSTIINYDLPEDSRVTLKVYDILGREITTLVNEYKQAGRYNVAFNASHFATGIYIYELRANDFVSVKKMSFVK